MSDITQNSQRDLLPIYVLGADNNKIQEPVFRLNGYSKYQITICLEGSGIFVDEHNAEHKIEKGDLFFFSPNIPHKYMPVSDIWKAPYIVFTGMGVSGLIQYLGFGDSMVLKGISADNFDKIASSFAQIYDTHFSNIATKTERVSALLYSMLIFISEVSSNTSITKPTAAMQHLAPAMNYINRHTSENISVDDLADVLQISAGRVSVLFKEAFNMTPLQVIRRCKLEDAKRLLATHPNMKMKDLIKSVGFTSVSYFVTVFKKEYGMSPTEYKNSITDKSGWW